MFIVFLFVSYKYPYMGDSRLRHFCVDRPVTFGECLGCLGNDSLSAGELSSLLGKPTLRGLVDLFLPQESPRSPDTPAIVLRTAPHLKCDESCEVSPHKACFRYTIYGRGGSGNCETPAAVGA